MSKDKTSLEKIADGGQVYLPPPKISFLKNQDKVEEILQPIDATPTNKGMTITNFERWRNFEEAVNEAIKQTVYYINGGSKEYNDLLDGFHNIKKLGEKIMRIDFKPTEPK